MDQARFDHVARLMADRPSRRSILSLTAGALGAVVLEPISDVLGKGNQNRNKRKRKKKQKVETNAFGCVDVGAFCQTDDQCCSGLCQGNQGKKTCQAHDQSTCQPGEDVCLGSDEVCTTTTGAEGACVTTTGKASYCFGVGNCSPCAKDADCVQLVGAGAACIVCAECAGENAGATACVGLGLP